MRAKLYGNGFGARRLERVCEGKNIATSRPRPECCRGHPDACRNVSTSLGPSSDVHRQNCPWRAARTAYDAAQAPGYQAFVNLGCCQEQMLLVRERNQVTPSEAMKFVEFETYGSLNHKRILYRRPDVESFVYQVSFRIFYP